MSGKKLFSSNLDETFWENVKHGNNISICVLGKSNIKVLMNNSITLLLACFIFHHFWSNLISLSQLQERDFVIIIHKDCCQINHPYKGSIAHVKMTRNQIFPFQTQTEQADPICHKSIVQDLTWLWHYQYGHLNFNRLKTLQQKKMVKWLPQI